MFAKFPKRAISTKIQKFVILIFLYMMAKQDGMSSIESSNFPRSRVAKPLV